MSDPATVAWANSGYRERGSAGGIRGIAVGWVRHQLRDVTTKIGSGATPCGGETAYKSKGISLIRSLNVHDAGFRMKDLAFLDDAQAKGLDNVIVEPEDVLINITGASIARCCIVPENILPARVNQHVTILRPIKGKLLPELLHYLLISKAYKDQLLHAGDGAGATRQALTKAQLQEFWIHYPESLPEQRRIVGILDEALAGIATAKANAEKNLRNARELFAADLRVAFDGEWDIRPLRDILIAQPRNGWSPPKEFQTGTGVPVLTLSSVTGFQYDGTRIRMSSAPTRDDAHYWLRPGELLITRSNTRELVGHVAIHDGTPARAICCDLIMKMVVDPKQAVTRFVYYFLRSPTARTYLTTKAHGASSTMKKISKDIVQSIQIPVPPLPIQKRIIEQLDTIQFESKQLESVYNRKLATLDALKKSLLHQAFAGQLTLTIEQPSSPANLLIPFPLTIPGISTTDLHAGILAIACEQHEVAGKLGDFTHVKAEKFAHMVEARLGIDLGRAPVKDAAGPNDFNHLKKVEHRAKMTNAFDFKRVDGGAYRVQKLHGFDRLIKKTQAALGDRLSDVQKLLTWMLPMSVRQAEIAATVYAAWNNLLLDGKNPSDEEIVHESRENWHPEKLKIERDRFFLAVKWLREQGVVPEGRGKRVGAKGGNNASDLS
jgi:type I restriction enzyme S subunit